MTALFTFSNTAGDGFRVGAGPEGAWESEVAFCEVGMVEEGAWNALEEDSADIVLVCVCVRVSVGDSPSQLHDMVNRPTVRTSREEKRPTDMSKSP